MAESGGKVKIQKCRHEGLTARAWVTVQKRLTPEGDMLVHVGPPGPASEGRITCHRTMAQGFLFLPCTMCRLAPCPTRVCASRIGRRAAPCLGYVFDTQIIDSSDVMGVLRNNRGYRNALMLKELELGPKHKAPSKPGAFGRHFIQGKITREVAICQGENGGTPIEEPGFSTTI